MVLRLKRRRASKISLVLAALLFAKIASPGLAVAQDAAEVPPLPNVNLSITQPQTGKEIAFSLQILVLLTILSLSPSILILLTCFLRLSVVLDFVKRALGLQQVPSTVVLNGIAFFMTIFIMWPTFNQIYERAFKPVRAGELDIEAAAKEAMSPMRMFMYRQMRDDTSNITLFMSMARLGRPANLSEVPTRVLIPAYILHELTAAFKIGILLYIPFVVIDFVVASILLALGMAMLPVAQISMPFKLILFVLVDGWSLLTQQFYNSIAG